MAAKEDDELLRYGSTLDIPETLETTVYAELYKVDKNKQCELTIIKIKGPFCLDILSFDDLLRQKNWFIKTDSH